MILQKMKWLEVKRNVKKGTIVIVPVGSTEQHGPHLPIDTDIAIPYYVAVKAAEQVNVIVAPPVNYGYNEKELRFPGTVSVKAQTFINYLFDICDSLTRTGFNKILLLNGHGWNEPMVNTVCHMVNEKADCVCVSITYWRLIEDLGGKLRESEKPGGMGHAGEFETSVQLFLDPKHIDMDKAVKEVIKQTKYTWYDLFISAPVMIAQPWDKLTKSGVNGNPLLATKEKGERFIDAIIERLVKFLQIYDREISV